LSGSFRKYVKFEKSVSLLRRRKPEARIDAVPNWPSVGEAHDRTPTNPSIVILSVVVRPKRDMMKTSV
jgi:hypothetical protein